jgi:O-antigen/teichoic acid export membrane protein
VLINAATTVAMPLTVSLRLGLVTLIEVGRQVVLVAAIILLVAAGAHLGAFFWAYAASGVAMAVLVIALVDRRSVVAPRLSWPSWRPILRETAPLALSVAINTFYLRLLIVLASLLIAEDEVGRFATASRVTEVLAALPAFMIGGAFPLLAHAGTNDEERLVYALQRIAEVSLLVGALFALILEIGAEPVIKVFAGPQFLDVVPVLRVQAVALVGASMTQVWVLGAVAVGAQRALLWVNGVALGAVAVFGSVLIPTLHASGAALAAACGEAVLASAALAALVRARPALRPNFGYVPRVALSAAAGSLLVLSPLPDAVDAVLGAGVFLAVAWVVGAIPAEVVQAFRRRR